MRQRVLLIILLLAGIPRYPASLSFHRRANGLRKMAAQYTVGECKPDISNGKQSTTQDGRLLSSRRHDASADAGLDAWRLLGGGRQRNGNHGVMPWLETGMERTLLVCGVPARCRHPADHVSTCSRRRLLLRLAFCHGAAGELQHR